MRPTRRSRGTAGGQDLAACRRDFAEPLGVGVMLDDEDADVLEFGDLMGARAPSFSLAARTTLFWLAASSARLKVGSDSSYALTPVAAEAAQAPTKP